MDIYKFNKDINEINNLNEGEYANYMLNNIENSINYKSNIDLNNKGYINKEIKF